MSKECTQMLSSAPDKKLLVSIGLSTFYIHFTYKFLEQIALNRLISTNTQHLAELDQCSRDLWLCLNTPPFTDANASLLELSMVLQKVAPALLLGVTQSQMVSLMQASWNFQ